MAVDEWLATINTAIQRSFGDAVKIQVGITTTVDNVFLGDNWERCAPLAKAKLLFHSLFNIISPWTILRHLTYTVTISPNLAGYLPKLSQPLGKLIYTNRWKNRKNMSSSLVFITSREQSCLRTLNKFQGLVHLLESGHQTGMSYPFVLSTQIAADHRARVMATYVFIRDLAGSSFVLSFQNLFIGLVGKINT